MKVAPKHASSPPPSHDTAKEYQQLLRGEISSKQYVDAVRSAVRARHGASGRLMYRSVR